MEDLSRWLIAIGVVAASVGFLLWGMGTSYVDPHDGMITTGVVLMVGGLAGAIVGGIAHRSTS